MIQINKSSTVLRVWLSSATHTWHLKPWVQFLAIQTKKKNHIFLQIQDGKSAKWDSIFHPLREMKCWQWINTSKAWKYTKIDTNTKEFYCRIPYLWNAQSRKSTHEWQELEGRLHEEWLLNIWCLEQGVCVNSSEITEVVSVQATHFTHAWKFNLSRDITKKAESVPIVSALRLQTQSSRAVSRVFVMGEDLPRNLKIDQKQHSTKQEFKLWFHSHWGTRSFLTTVAWNANLQDCKDSYPFPFLYFVCDKVPSSRWPWTCYVTKITLNLGPHCLYLRKAEV